MFSVSSAQYTVKIDHLEKQRELKNGVTFKAIVTKQPYYRSWSVPGDTLSKREWRNDIDKLDPKTEERILRYMKLFIRNLAKGTITVDITDFPMIECTFEEEYDPYTFSPSLEAYAYTAALSQKTVPVTLVNQGISLRSTKQFPL